MTGVAPAALVLGALACLLLALALWLLARAHRQAQARSIHAHLQRSLELPHNALPGATPPREAAPLGLGAPGPVQAREDAPAPLQWLERRLGLSSWGIAPRTLQGMAGACVLLTLLAVLKAGAAGLLALPLCALLCAFGIWRRMGLRREKLLLQLPGFLDNMVRLISIGNSPHAAFQLAAGNVPAPLGDALQQATATLSASPDLGQAMALLERNWGLPEFGLLAAVFRMSTRYGGRADLVLERVSAYIRDRQSAERELHALSAEIRLSAWVLALLPIVVGSLIMVLNQGYFMRMWNDASGRNMILVAAALEACGSFLLYRLARLR